MRAKAIQFIAAAGVLILASCSTVSVTTDYDRSASFSKYKTYSLASAENGQKLSPSSEAALQNALRSEMAKKGIVEKKSGKPDIAIARHVFLQDKISVDQSADWGYARAGYWPYGYGYYNGWDGSPHSYVDVHQYTQGTMILDFVDTKSNKLVFRGKGTAVTGKPEANADKITQAVTRIVADLPAN